MATRVVSKKWHKDKEGIYIGRPGPYGNDWSHLNQSKAIHVATSVMASVFFFTDWLVNGVDFAAQSFRNDIMAGIFHNQTIICWCVDEDGKGHCHGNVVKSLSDLIHVEGRPPAQAFNLWKIKVNQKRSLYGPSCDCDLHWFSNHNQGFKDHLDAAIAHQDWDENGTIDCEACTNGTYYISGYFENNIWKGSTGMCFRCRGKGRQNQDDYKRNFWYDMLYRRYTWA